MLSQVREQFVKNKLLFPFLQKTIKQDFGLKDFEGKYPGSRPFYVFLNKGELHYLELYMKCLLRLKLFRVRVFSLGLFK